jgi:hypothetical protein
MNFEIEGSRGACRLYVEMRNVQVTKKDAKNPDEEGGRACNLLNQLTSNSYQG